MRSIITPILAGMLLTTPSVAQVPRETGPGEGRFSVPDSVSPQAKTTLGDLYSTLAKVPVPKEPVTLADYDALNAEVNPSRAAASRQIMQSAGATATEDRIGGVPVLRISPAKPRIDAGPIVFVHGGGFFLFSAQSTSGTAATISAASGREVISIDYTLAPRGNYRTITDQVVSVWKSLLAAGHSASAMGLSGDSAGGNIAAGSTLKMRDQGIAMPGALYLLSPSTDLSQPGDTYKTLKDADPIVSADQLAWVRKAYVGNGDVRSPYASPVNGDFAKSFPATLIQVGTREVMLSDSVRLYQAIRGGGGEAVLDLYEGMPHVFQTFAPFAPETRTANARASEFFDKHLQSDHCLPDTQTAARSGSGRLHGRCQTKCTAR